MPDRPRRDSRRWTVVDVVNGYCTDCGMLTGVILEITRNRQYLYVCSDCLKKRLAEPALPGRKRR